MNSKHYSIHKEMGINHADLFRLLPTAVKPYQFTVSEKQINITGEDRSARSVVINYSKERVRKIASMEIPVTDLELVFTGFDEDQIQDFLQRFDQTYQRGGG